MLLNPRMFFYIFDSKSFLWYKLKYSHNKLFKIDITISINLIRSFIDFLFHNFKIFSLKWSFTMLKLK